MDKLCKDCEYYVCTLPRSSRKTWMGEIHQSEMGECRFNPPSFWRSRESSQKFPSVEEFDWCGQFKRKESNETD